MKAVQSHDWYWIDNASPPMRWSPNTYGVGIPGFRVAQGRCIFCGQYVWSMRELVEHFQAAHGRYVGGH